MQMITRLPAVRPPLRVPKLLRVVLLPLLLSSCDLLIAPGPEQDRAELERNWRLWQVNGGSNYYYVQQRLCFCIAESTAAVRIGVRNGVVTERRWLSDNLMVPLQYASLWGTVEDLFRLIEAALDDHAESLLVTYDGKLGYPTHIAIDYRKNTADEEITITASTLVLLRQSTQQ